MLLNAYLICLRCTRGSTIKNIVRLWGLASDGNIPLPLMTKGEIFTICRGQRQDSRGRNGHRDAEDRGMVPRGSMNDMNSVLHGIISILHHIASINSKGGYC
jgi:hypothetical protein